jgi:hypothetical protein
MEEGKTEIDPEMLEHFDKVHRSMLNDLFDGEEALKSEAFYRAVTGQQPFTKEEIEARVNKWIETEKEIWGISTETQS